MRDQPLDATHRSSLQRMDLGRMAWQGEIHEPFLDRARVVCARGLEAADLLGVVAGRRQANHPLRRLFDLYSDERPTVIRNRLKVPMGEGCGLDLSAH